MKFIAFLMKGVLSSPEMHAHPAPPPPQKKNTPNSTASLVIFVCLFFDLCINGVILVLSDNIQRYACDLNGIFKIVHGIKVAVV